ncbi:MAG: YidC/Oxa1 family membrane protein insertase [Clostridia bacterium]|jgi:YidC/Oxa1 family membrane protein insertase|nr:YidC/Oxa1 family membrane protein insertase [Clostridia bacterium]
MIGFFANLFGYLLNFLYNLIQNYGLAIILFSIIVKILLLPISINQQKTMKKTTKIQSEIKKLQIKNKNNPEALQRETMELYKREKMNPFGGCFSAIVQIILLFSVFYLVRCPLTYMKKVEPEIIEKYTNEISGEEDRKDAYPEISIIREKAQNDEKVYINMEFLGLDLSSIPSRDIADWKTYVIPVLYVISTFASLKITSAMQKKQRKEMTVEGEEQDDGMDLMTQTNRNMTFMMPILAVSISLVAPLGLALYWLTNNILMIVERLLLNKFVKDNDNKEEIVNA